jgi:hypothetical protein
LDIVGAVPMFSDPIWSVSKAIWRTRDRTLKACECIWTTRRCIYTSSSLVSRGTECIFSISRCHPRGSRRQREPQGWHSGVLGWDPEALRSDFDVLRPRSHDEGVHPVDVKIDLVDEGTHLLVSQMRLVALRMNLVELGMQPEALRMRIRDPRVPPGGRGGRPSDAPGVGRGRRGAGWWS